MMASQDYPQRFISQLNLYYKTQNKLVSLFALLSRLSRETKQQEKKKAKEMDCELSVDTKQNTGTSRGRDYDDDEKC